MLTWIRIALRNLMKNRRRSFFTILAVAIGFGAVNVFGGFTEYIFSNLKESFIYLQGNGHLTVVKKGYHTEGKLDPLKFILSEAEAKSIEEICRNDPNVILVSPQLSLSGLISNGQVSTIFIGVGRVPSDVAFMQKRAKGMVATLKLYDGRDLDDEISYGVGLSRGLAKKLKLDIGSDGIAMAPTVEGQINALDLQVFQLFNTMLEELDDKVMRVNLKFAQSLYNTTSVDQVTVLLNDDPNLQDAQRRLQEALTTAGLDIEVSTWEELSPFYRKVKDMFSIIFLFIFFIVFVIVVMSVINTISMSIMERTREIGTLRALGLKRRGIVQLFAIESAVLGAVGTCFGMMLTVLAWLGVMLFEPTWIPPSIPRRVPLEVYLVPGYMAASFVFLMVLSVASAMLPARKAAYMGIVDALGHV